MDPIGKVVKGGGIVECLQDKFGEVVEEREGGCGVYAGSRLKRERQRCSFRARHLAESEELWLVVGVAWCDCGVVNE